MFYGVEFFVMVKHGTTWVDAKYCLSTLHFSATVKFIVVLPSLGLC